MLKNHKITILLTKEKKNNHFLNVILTLHKKTIFLTLSLRLYKCYF